MAKQLISLPADDGSYSYQQLGYVDAYDAVINCDYAYLAYKETDKSGGAWRVRIKGNQTAGTVCEPDMMRSNARQAGAHDKPYFVWGYRFETSPSDPRQVEFRIHQKDGEPSEVEMVLGMRKGDGSAGPVKSVKFPWPQD